MIRFAVLAALFFAAGSAVAQETPAALYARCMHEARTAPAVAVQTVRGWTGDAARHCEAVALLTIGRYAEAAARFRHLAEVGGTEAFRADLLAQAAQALLLDNQPEEAETVLSQALGLRPQTAALWVDRAVARAEQFRFADAVKDLNHALDLDPADVDAYVFRATALRKLDKLPKAMADVEKALAMKPRHAEALLERGNLRRLTGDRYGARADWQAVLAGWPETAAARAAAANIQRLDNPPELQAPPVPEGGAGPNQ